jgi:hypothetical protein
MRSKTTLLFLILYGCSFSQISEDWIDQVMDDYLNQNPDALYDVQEIEIRLLDLIEHPVILDRNNLTAIDRLFFLNPVTRANIKEHIQINGNLISKYELQSIDGINESLARNLSYLIKLKSDEFKLKKKKFKVSIKSGIRQLLNPAIGYQNKKYLGSSHRFFFRSKFTIGHKLQFGISLDKDPGENYWNHNYFMKVPHFSAYVGFKGKKVIKNLILGDYKLMIGQGLLIYQGYGFGKTIHLTGNIKTESGIRPNSSLSENFFLRGFAADIQLRNFSVLPFLSYKPLSATIYTDTVSYFKSIDLSGSLKTENEQNKQGQLKELLAGLNILYRFKKLRLSLNYIYSRYNYPYRNKAKVYQVFNENSSQFHHLSFGYKLHIKNGFFFGESAVKIGSKAIATSNGLVLSLNEKTSILTSFRYFSPAYFSFYSSGISENSTCSNELGFLFNLQHELNRKLTISAYFDYFYFPWLKFNVDRPSHGFEFNSRFHYKWNRKMTVYLNSRIKLKEENIDNHFFTHSLLQILKFQSRIHFQKEFDKKLSFSTRLDYNLRKGLELQQGFLWYLNIQYQPKSKFMIAYRFNLFTTESFENSIYSLERSIGTVNQFSVYFGEGLSSYIFIKIKPIRSLTIQFRLSWTHYFNQTSIGSGDAKIIGSNRGEVGLEIGFNSK